VSTSIRRENLTAVDSNQSSTAAEAPAAKKTRLQRFRWPLISLAAIAVLGGGAYFYIKGSRYQSTDDAYAQAATVSVSANVGGRVSEIGVRDNELVRRGATLFKLDDAPYRIAVSDAAARLADTRLLSGSRRTSRRFSLPACARARQRPSKSIDTRAGSSRQRSQA
jgi:membrane fusion protein, multidrug efflux system